MESNKPVCRYGSKCYRKNPEHLSKFRHLLESEQDEPESEKEKGYESDTEGSDSSAPKPLENDDAPPSNRKRRRRASENHADVNEKADKIGDDGRGKRSNSGRSSVGTLPYQTSYEDRKNLVKQYCLFDMPDDFYALWDLAADLDHEDPCNAFSELGLVLCGPFDLFAGKMDLANASADDFILCCRYYYDVPEFQTVIREQSKDDGEQSLFHIGYLRDIEQVDGPIVCSNDGTDCKLTIMGDSLFAAINDFAKSRRGTSKEITKLANAVVAAAEKHKFSLDRNSKKVKDRKKKVVSKAFHGAGIVVPMNGDVGYRPLGVSDDQLKKILQAFSDEGEKGGKGSRDPSSSKLQELITYVQFANDECDFGMGYELGTDLFCAGFSSLHPYVDQLLSVAYALLKRDEFKTILNLHLAKRQRGTPSMAPL